MDSATDMVLCELCSQSIPASMAMRANGHRVCSNCAMQLSSELAAGAPPASLLPLAVIGGGVGAIIGAAVWAGIAIATEFEIGYVAVLVGFLAGTGVKLGARGGHGRTLQIIAVAWSVFGLLLSKYLIFAHFFSQAALKEAGVNIGYFSAIAIATFPKVLFDVLGVFDLLWLGLAVMAAWRVPKSPNVVLA